MIGFILDLFVVTKHRDRMLDGARDIDICVTLWSLRIRKNLKSLKQVVEPDWRVEGNRKMNINMTRILFKKAVHVSGQALMSTGLVKVSPLLT